MDNWIIIGLALLFWPVIAASIILTGVLVWFMWLITLSTIKGIWGDFFGR